MTTNSRDFFDALTQLGASVKQRVQELSGALEQLFSAHWPEERDAKTATRVFTAALALTCAGIVGAVSVVSPSPAVAIRPLMPAATAGAGAAAAEPVAAAAATPAEATPPTAPAAGAAPPPVVPTAKKGALPVGKGMWIWLPERVEGGDPDAIVAKASDFGLTHLYVRTGSSRMGFYAQDFLNRLLPVAHARNIRVIGWDFPYFDSWSDDVFRALAAIHYTTPDGHRIDGFSADIETPSEGTNISAHHATEYGGALRKFVGPNYPLIATIPRPSQHLIATGYPFGDIVRPFDAIAPMVYWHNRDPGSDVAGALAFLATFEKPIIPVGQAYDGSGEGGPAGVPSRDQLIRFMQVADQFGAAGVSFWSWQHADAQAWQAIYDAAEFRLHAGPPGALTPGMIRAYQVLLNSLGFRFHISGAWDDATAAAIGEFQRSVKLPVTGIVDAGTQSALFRPIAPPIQPQA